MGRKRALVVDDSKSARVILSRILEKYDIEVDMAESAVEAIEYLNQHRPDAIFMDHLMPGMDGFEAVKAIKGDPRTATIPIMMYTSQQGDLYVGQARALGAIGVLPKQVRPVDVSKVLYELNLLPERRELTEPMPDEVSTLGIETAIKQHSVDIRRFIVSTLDGFAARIVNDVRELTPASPPSALPTSTAAARAPVWPWVAALLATCSVAILCAVVLLMSREDAAKSRAQIAALSSENAELRHARQELAATVDSLTATMAAATAPSVNLGAAARIEPVPYGEVPFDRSRLDALREYLGKLEGQGFRGVVKLTSAVGLFCLSGNAGDGFAPASPGLPASKCDLVGNPFEESLRGQQRQSLAFANLVASVRQRTSGAVAVFIENTVSSRAATPYPVRSDGLTAGDWNRAATANNRVEFAAEASP